MRSEAESPGRAKPSRPPSPAGETPEVRASSVVRPIFSSILLIVPTRPGTTPAARLRRAAGPAPRRLQPPSATVRSTAPSPWPAAAPTRWPAGRRPRSPSPYRSARSRRARPPPPEGSRPSAAGAGAASYGRYSWTSHDRGSLPGGNPVAAVRGRRACGALSHSYPTAAHPVAPSRVSGPRRPMARTSVPRPLGGRQPGHLRQVRRGQPQPGRPPRSAGGPPLPLGARQQRDHGGNPARQRRPAPPGGG